MLADVREVLRADTQVGRDLRQQRRFAEVVRDELGQERVHRLVVGDARARRVGQRHVALAIDVHEAGHADEAVAPECQRVDEVVVDPAVDDVHLLPAPRRAHEDLVVLDDQVVPLDEEHAHLAGQEGVLEVGGVRHARREDDHDRVLGPLRCGVEQRVEEEVRVVLDGPHRVGGEELGEDAAQDVAVLEHVGDARWAAAVVLEDEVVAATVADEVGADDMGVDALGRDHAEQLALVLPAREHELGWDDAVLETLLALVDIEDEEVQRGDALNEAGLDPLPLAGGDDARHEVERKDPLGPLLLAVHREGDALVHQRELL